MGRLHYMQARTHVGLELAYYPVQEFLHDYAEEGSAEVDKYFLSGSPIFNSISHS